MTAYNKLLAPHQITNGGNLIMVQIENEFSGQQFSNGTENWDAIAYMEKLEKNARDNGLKIVRVN
jgi:beta-galactosidase GanA